MAELGSEHERPPGRSDDALKDMELGGNVSKPETSKPETPAIKTEPTSDTGPADADEDQGEDETPPKKGPAMCGVCKTTASKYKCSRCYLPYCSVACNKAHQANHPPDLKPKSEPDDEPPSASLPAKPSGPLNPFSALDNSDKLAWLFRKYPNLPQQLLDIHAETQPPPEDPSKHIPASLLQGVAAPRRNNWTRDQGIKKGKSALRKARQQPGKDGEGVREYCTLIRMLVNDGEANDGATATLQQQFAQEDADIIRQLMEEERDRH
ncbi:zinc finger domain-containing protein [Purpureocillium lavendulum]|uniref:Zinc finger domain-containing protein n=1 Tax=Purpureocillium lavendulum TaxID=1247861 RepID=A0AB34FL42_9HYPO|nr:zinc finger domain-containing protein [Purpureocillium lavendulum]